MRLLVLGGAGYIGSVVVAQLVEAGYDVTVCDDLSTGNAWAVPPDVRFVPASVADRESLERVVADGYDAVLHCAGASAGSLMAGLRANLSGSLNLLEAMRAHGVRRLVFSSSAAVYGAPHSLPVEEGDALRPASPSGVWRLAVEHAIGLDAAAGGLGAVSLRSFNVAGARGPLGEWHHPETHLIPLVLQAAAGVRPAVPVYGTDYDTSDGTARRDYVHVDDVARAHVLALEATVERGHRVYNLGTGAAYSVREVIDLARAVTGHRIPSVDAARREGDAPELVASTERARRDLGWVATRPLGETLVDAWRWMRSRIGAGAAEPVPMAEA